MAKEPENLDNLANFTSDNMNEFFNWGNDKFVLGQLGASKGEVAGRKKKSARDIFMEAILDPEI